MDYKQLEAENNRLMRRNEKLDVYYRMWEKLKDWKQKKLKEDDNNYLLHDLSDKINRLERDMYEGRD